MKKAPKPKLRGSCQNNKLSAPKALTATWCSIKRRICSRSFYIVCRMTYAVCEVVRARYRSSASSGVKQPILFVSELLAELLLQGDVIKIVDTHGVAHLTHGLSCHLTGLF